MHFIITPIKKYLGSIMSIYTQPEPDSLRSGGRRHDL